MTLEREAAAGRFTDLARQADPDRFLTVMPAPSAHRTALCVLILLNHELVRATEQPSARSGAGPIAALIRLQWWREVIENSRADWHNQPVAVAVRALLDQRRVRMETLLALIGAREAEAEGLATVEAWRQAMLDGPGGVQRAIGELLGVDPSQADRLASAGAAYGCGALRRHLPALLANERGILPAAIETTRPVAELRAFLASEGERFLALAGAQRASPGQRAAWLPLVLARRDLRGDSAAFDRSAGARGLGDRLAVLAAAIGR